MELFPLIFDVVSAINFFFAQAEIFYKESAGMCLECCINFFSFFYSHSFSRFVL